VEVDYMTFDKALLASLTTEALRDVEDALYVIITSKSITRDEPTKQWLWEAIDAARGELIARESLTNRRTVPGQLSLVDDV
jgi:hypothetical protein